MNDIYSQVSDMETTRLYWETGKGILPFVFAPHLEVAEVILYLI